MAFHFDMSDVTAMVAMSPLERRLAVAVAARSKQIESAARQNAPVDTGFLKGTILAESQGLHAEIGPWANYGAYVEYGTAKMQAQPYMGPAADLVEPYLTKDVEGIAAEVLS